VKLTRKLLILVAAGALVALAAPGAAQAEVECKDQNDQPIAGCVTFEGPWVSVPEPQTYGQVGATWNANCPQSGANAVGSDWNSPNPYAIDVFVQQISGTTVYEDALNVSFLATHSSGRAQTFQPLIGCQPPGNSLSAGGASAAAKRGSKPVRRVATKTLRPNRLHRFTHGCGKKKLLGSGSGVGFFQKRPPSVKELSDLRVRRSESGGKVRVRVKTGQLVGDDEKVRIQIHAVCGK
jgi:hypothetical protein